MDSSGLIVLEEFLASEVDGRDMMIGDFAVHASGMALEVVKRKGKSMWTTSDKIIDTEVDQSKMKIYRRDKS